MPWSTAKALNQQEFVQLNRSYLRSFVKVRFIIIYLKVRNMPVWWVKREVSLNSFIFFIHTAHVRYKTFLGFPVQLIRSKANLEWSSNSKNPDWFPNQVYMRVRCSTWVFTQNKDRYGRRWVGDPFILLESCRTTFVVFFRKDVARVW